MIWCVEDDAGIRDIEIYTLTSTGFEARGFESGEELFAALEREKPELILLDIMLPGEDGVAILKRLKSRADCAAVPVIMATAKGTEYDKVLSLDLGADDYLVKPFGMMEMVSRIRAVLRRCGASRDAAALRVGGIELDPEAHTVKSGGERVELTYKEFELLLALMKSPGKVLTRQRLFNDVWGTDYVGESRTLDMHIRTLRQKLGGCGEQIQTVRNVGYRLEGEK